MKLKVGKIYNQGKENEEHVMLRVTEDCDLQEYLVADTTFDEEGEVSNELRHVFWFPPKKGEEERRREPFHWKRDKQNRQKGRRNQAA